MTTTVPEGTSDGAVEETRVREAARSRELAAQGKLLRLWRPPLQPGEWRTLGLFAAEDDDQLEAVLVSMPLRVWRSDVVMALWPHPNDPSTASPRCDMPEFLTEFTITIPVDAPREMVDETEALEARRARALAEEGHLLRLWALAGQGRALGLWQARNSTDMRAILDSLPLNDWMTVETTPLSPHPSDPARITS